MYEIAPPQPEYPYVMTEADNVLASLFAERPDLMDGNAESAFAKLIDGKLSDAFRKATPAELFMCRAPAMERAMFAYSKARRSHAHPL